MDQMRLESDDFEPNADLPWETTQYGENRSPHLRWRNVPEGTRSLVLIVTDPDAPDPAAPIRTNVHWTLFNLDPDRGELLPGHGDEQPSAGAQNYTGETGYLGPKSPKGKPRYFHRLYALDCSLDLPHGASTPEVEAAMAGHVLAEAELMGISEPPAR